MSWTEQEAVDRWLDDLEAEAGAAELVTDRLKRPPIDPDDVIEAAFREAASRWLERGQGQVALTLLERGQSPDGRLRPASALGQGAGMAAELEVLLAGRPGEAGLPALTPDETEALRQTTEPEEALEVLRGARARLEVHGQEARRLLRRWLERQRS